jgi:drug/metabolite transporter (DMT)-like permease
MRYLVAVGTLVTGTMYIVMIYGDGLIGSHYWKYYFWTMIVSAIGSAVAFIGTK